MPGIHQRFGDNLRRQCSRFASIADVCRGTGISRQQFNKYLDGHSIPNADGLRRICDYLGIDEGSLFENNEPPIPKRSAGSDVTERPAGDSRRDLTALMNGVWNNAEGTLGSACDLIEEGFYYCYFPLQQAEDFLLRSLVAVDRQHDQMVFKRTTHIPSQANGNACLAKGQHAGTVTANLHDIYFLGINSSFPHQLSLLAFCRTNTSKPPILTGLAITRSQGGLFSARVCLQYLGVDFDTRKLLRTLGPVSIGDPALNHHVAAAMTVSPQPHANYMDAPKLGQPETV